MKKLQINSIEGLEAVVADVVRYKIERTKAVAAKEGEVAELEKSWQPAITDLARSIQEGEEAVREYCEANRAAVFPETKSRETNLAVFGFELTPHRVETSSRKVKWKDVVARLLRLPWGKAYVRQPEAQPDKQALLSDREKLTPEQCVAAGISFERDEQFFIRPKPETAA